MADSTEYSGAPAEISELYESFDKSSVPTCGVDFDVLGISERGDDCFRVHYTSSSTFSSSMVCVNASFRLQTGLVSHNDGLFWVICPIGHSNVF